MIDDIDTGYILKALKNYSRKSLQTTDEFIRSPISNYKNTGNRFLFANKNLKAPLEHIYFSRLRSIRVFIEKKFKSRKLAFTQVIDVKKNALTVVIGSLYKEMKMKPSILHRLNMEQVMGIEKFKENTSKDDFLYLEDETGRAILDFNEYESSINDEVKVDRVMIELDDELIVDKKQNIPQKLITGMIVGIIGRVDGVGHIYVKEIIFPDIPNNINDSILINIKRSLKEQGKELNKSTKNVYNIEHYFSTYGINDSFIAIVSGLNVKHNESQKGIISLIQFLKGTSSLIEIREVTIIISDNL